MDFSRDNDFILPSQLGPLDPRCVAVFVGSDSDARRRCIRALQSVVRPIAGRATVSNFDTGKTSTLTRKRLASWWDTDVESSLAEYMFLQIDVELEGTRMSVSVKVDDDGVIVDAYLSNSPDLPSHSRVLEAFANDFVLAAEPAQAWTSPAWAPSSATPEGDGLRPEIYVHTIYGPKYYPGWEGVPRIPAMRLFIGQGLLRQLETRDSAMATRTLSSPGWVSIDDLDDETLNFLNPLLLSYEDGPNWIPLYASRTDYEATYDSMSSPADESWSQETPAGTKFYTNITLVGADATSLLNWLRQRATSAYVEVSDFGCVVFDDNADRYGTHDDLARALSEQLGCKALVASNHDDDLLSIDVFDKGAPVDTYLSSPSFFAEEASELDEPTGGHRLASLFGVNPDALEDVLRSGYVEEHNRHEALIELLGLPSSAVWYNFDSFANGTAPEPSTPNASFVAIP